MASIYIGREMTSVRREVANVRRELKVASIGREVAITGMWPFVEGLWQSSFVLVCLCQYSLSICCLLYTEIPAPPPPPPPKKKKASGVRIGSQDVAVAYYCTCYAANCYKTF